MKNFIKVTAATAVYTSVISAAMTVGMLVPMAIYEHQDEIKDWFKNQKSLAHERKMFRIEKKIHRLECKLQDECNRVVDCTEEA